MPRYIKPLMLVAMSLALLVGCSPHPQAKAFQAGDVSRLSADSALRAIAIAHESGVNGVTDEVLVDAMQAYHAWQAAQQAYIDAVRYGTQDANLQARLAQNALMALWKIAAEYKVL